jgi:hypothetical protein
MKINLSKKEYKYLIDVLYLSDWMMNAHKDDSETYCKAHQALKKKLFSYYKEMESNDCIDYADEFDDYFLLRNYEEYLHETFIDPYDDDTFWEELIARLARRDFINEVGIDSVIEMDAEERVSRLLDIEKKYANEFEQHGLDHLNITYEKLKMN